MSCSKCRPGRGTDLVEEENADTPQNPTILLIGNPNVGKSTLFNTLTGARQAVVNAPGTTVEVMQGTWSALGARLLDLPGTYSLIATSPDEQVVVDTLAGAPAGGCMAPDSTASAAAALHRSPQDEADDLFSWLERVDTEAFGVRKASTTLSLSDKIDRFLLHPVVGIPVFFALMWLLFKVAGEWVGPVQDLFDGFFTSQDEGAWSLANALDALLFGVGLHDTWVQGLLVGGLSTGLGVVASFLPLMFVIFLLISILEDSGYMARAAFLGDRVMRAIGLDGRVILPLIMGFGCNLPSLAATRTLPDAKQRLVTTLVIPYTSCAARLTIYLMIARIFFPAHTGSVVFVMYVFSLVMVVLGALVLKPFITKDSSQAPLMLVLPAYQAPRVLVTVKNTAMRAWAFVAGAGKIIIVMTLVVWLMGAIPVAGGYSFAQSDLPMDKSLYGRTAQILEPVFAPAGFGEWHLTGALMTGFVAKETVISSIVTSYNLDPAVEGGDAEDGGEDLGSLPELVTGSFAASAGDAAPIAAFAFLVFVLTYTPCLATVAEQARQIGGRRTAAAVAVQFGAAWLLATLIFQAGRLVL